MSLDQKVNALTAALRSEFWKSYTEAAQPAEWEEFTQTIPSTTKIENYVQFTPVPGMSLWEGYRNYGSVDSFIYSVQNLPWQNGFAASLEDVEDDQTGGLMRKPSELVVRAKLFPGRAVLKQLSLASSTAGFDGTNFVASSHTFGSGNNSLTFTSASGDGNNHNLYALYTGNGVLKPLIWQKRSGPDFNTNAGTPQSKESKQLRWWTDLRGAAAYGWWWDCVKVAITGTPNIAEMFQIYQNIKTAFRGFVLPKTVSSEDGEYVHEQTKFSSKNLWLAGSVGLDSLLAFSLSQALVPMAAGVGANVVGSSGTAGVAAADNLFKGFANYIVSNFL